MFNASSTKLLTPPAGSRLLVQESIFPKVVKKLRDRIQTLRLGNPLDKNTDIGAINNQPQLEKIRELVQCGADEGAEGAHSPTAAVIRS
jgi:aldehyde dehydrogenase (NAD+)